MISILTFLLSLTTGAFLLPYFICVIIGGIPLFFLEVAVGQFMSIGGTKAWNIVPLFQGKFICVYPSYFKSRLKYCSVPFSSGQIN